MDGQSRQAPPNHESSYWKVLECFLQMPSKKIGRVFLWRHYNIIGDRGAQLVSAVIATVHSLIPTVCENLVVAFNSSAEEVASQINSLDQRQNPVSRKQRNLEWLRCHSHELHQLSQRPFGSVEMWTLHQHYFSLSIAPSAANVVSTGKSNCSLARQLIPAKAMFIQMAQWN